MKMKKIALWVLLSSLLAPTASAQVPADPLAGLDGEPIDLELKGAPVSDVFLLLGDIAHVEWELSACVSGELTMKLRSVTVRTVSQAIADSLGLSFSAGDDGRIVVDCAATGGEDQRLDFQAADLPLEDALSVLGDAGGLSIRTDSCDGLRVDLRVAHASPRTVLSEVVAQARATLETRPDGLVVRCGDA